MDADRPAPGKHRRRLLLAALCGLSLLLLAPLAWRLGANLEEVAGFVPVAPDWQYADQAAEAKERPAPVAGVTLRATPDLPVWGAVGSRGGYLPLMVDGHIGAVTFLPVRAAAALGGLTGARVVSALGAVLLLLILFVLGERVFGPGAGWLAVLLAGTSPLFLTAHYWARPDENGAFFYPAVAIFALLRFADGHGRRWLWVAALFLGLGLATKNTTLWTVIALVLTARVFALLPPLSWRQWAVGGLLALLPLVPQVVFTLASPSSGTLTERVDRIPLPWEAFTATRLRFFATHFVDAFGGLGSYLGSYMTGRPAPLGPLPGVGVLLLAAPAVLAVLVFWRTAPRAVRAFGLALGLVLVEYVAFYYAGQSLFLLVTPWIPLAVAGVATLAWRAAGGLERPGLRRLGRGLLLGAGALLLVNQGIQVALLQRAAVAPRYALFDRAAQERLVGDLRVLGVTRPWTTTYALVGVLEVLSNGQLRPRHAFPLLRDACGPGRGPEAFAPVWERVLARMGPGEHHLVLTPAASPLEISPCRGGVAMTEVFYRVAAARGVEVRGLRRYSTRGGGPGFELVALRVPVGAGTPVGSAPPAAAPTATPDLTPASRPSIP